MIQLQNIFTASQSPEDSPRTRAIQIQSVTICLHQSARERQDLVLETGQNSLTVKTRLILHQENTNQSHSSKVEVREKDIDLRIIGMRSHSLITLNKWRTLLLLIA